MVEEFYGKISRSGSNLSDNSEDKLTGDFFGALRYMDFCDGLQPILCGALRISEKQQETSQTAIQLIENVNCTNIRDEEHIKFWPKHELGELGKRVYGIHLHQSLSGAYTREMMRRHVGWKTSLDWQAAMDYVMHVDQHQPFHTDAARRIVETVQPMYLVNEFQHRSRDDLVSKLHIQQRATAHY